MQPDIALLQKQAEHRVEQTRERNRRLCEGGPFFDKTPKPKKTKTADDRILLLLLLLLLIQE
jgi:hypothetical protein